VEGSVLIEIVKAAPQYGQLALFVFFALKLIGKLDRLTEEISDLRITVAGSGLVSVPRRRTDTSSRPRPIE
jgi:hypothetical protein